MKIWLSRKLRQIGSLLPNVYPFRAIGNRLLWPIHKALRLPSGTIKIFGMTLTLDIAECVDRNLWFTPHLYDHKEIKAAIEMLSPNTCFVDLGANIGWWSLRIAQLTNSVPVLAIEANPETFKILKNNTERNFPERIVPVNIAVTDKSGSVELHCSDSGNRGGDSLAKRSANSRSITVTSATLAAVLNRYLPDQRIGFLKVDIEGAELLALSPFFRDFPRNRLPLGLCVEHIHSNEIHNLLLSNGYKKMFQTNENSIYKMQDHSR